MSKLIGNGNMKKGGNNVNEVPAKRPPIPKAIPKDVYTKNNKKELIVETYKINNKEYSISYTEETKAKDLFDCLNRILINNNGMVTYKDISIRVKEPIIGVVAIEKRKGLGSWFIN